MTLSIGLLHYTAPPVVGGVEAVIGHHARLLADAGHRPRVIAGRGKATDRRVELVRVPLADARHPRVLAARAELDAGRVPEDFPRLVADLEAGLRDALADLDLVFVHNVCSMPFNLALTAALRSLLEQGLSPRLVAWHHDVDGGLGPGIAPTGRPWSLLREAWPGVRHVVVSDARLRDVAGALRLDPADITVVPAGVDEDAFLGLSPATRRIVRTLGLPAYGPVLLMPARLTPRKNVELAIEALAELRSDGSDARLIVTGPPDPHRSDDLQPYSRRLDGLIDAEGLRGAVHLLAIDHGAGTPARVVADLFRVADVLLLTSRDEGFGIPVLEAAVSRLPIVCPDLPSLRGLAGPAASYFAPDASPREVADAVRSRLASEAGIALRSRVRAQLTWTAVYAAAIEPLIASCIRSGPGDAPAA